MTPFVGSDGRLLLTADDFARVPPPKEPSQVPIFLAMVEMVRTGQINAWRMPDGNVVLTLPGVDPGKQPF